MRKDGLPCQETAVGATSSQAALPRFQLCSGLYGPAHPEEKAM